MTVACTIKLTFVAYLVILPKDEDKDKMVVKAKG